MRYLIRRSLITLSLLILFVGGTSSARAESIKAGQLSSVQIRHLHSAGAESPAGRDGRTASPHADCMSNESCGAFGAVQVNDAISESEYWDLVKESHQIVSNLKGASEAQLTSELISLAGRWETANSVMLDNGQVISLDNSYLLSILKATEPDLEHISGLLEALLAAHTEYPSGVFTTQDLDSLQQILARSEFQWPEEGTNPLAQFWQRLINELFRWLDRIFGEREVTIGGPSSLLYTVAVIALGVVLFFVFRTLFVDFITDARLAEDNIAEELLTSEAAFQKAQTLSRGGDYRSAVRFLYLSSLLLLDERGLLRYDRSKTNREYLRSVSNSPELAKPLNDVIEVFDDVWYGYHSVDEDKFKHYSDRVEELKDKKA